jgi:hypothetical protein
VAIIQCPACQGSVQMPEEMAGLRVVCPLCQATYQAPGPTPSEPAPPLAQEEEPLAEVPPEYRNSRSRNRRNRFAGLRLRDALPDGVDIALPRAAGANYADAAVAVQGPANALIIWSVLVWALSIIGICSGIGQVGHGSSLERADPVAFYVLLILFCCYPLLVLRGAIHMRRLSSYGWARAAAIMSLPTCVGLILGFWALGVLSRPDVKQAFGR